MKEKSSGQFKIGVVTTVYFPYSHADVIVSRWLQPRPDDVVWGWPKPRTKIKTMYVEQFAPEDLSRGLCEEHGVPLYGSVAEALCDGSDALAVDAVLLIGEHGEYPRNDLEQKLYPRKELFDKITDVFRASGCSVPVFCDKHLSWNFDWALEMDRTARQMGFMLISSSAVPFCRRVPPVDLAGNKTIDEAVAVFHGPDECYGYHSFEFAQAILEHRTEGETGMEAVTVYRGEDALRRLDDGTCSADLMEAALEALAQQDPKKIKEGNLRDNCRNVHQMPTAIVFEYCDGMRVTHVNLSGHIRGFGAAMRTQNGKSICTAPYFDDATHFHAHFATMSRIVEDAFLSNRPPFAPQRSLVTAGMTTLMMQARANPGVRLATPKLRIAYAPFMEGTQLQN